MLKSSSCDYNDAYILLSGTAAVAKLAAGGSYNNISVVFKYCAPFTGCINKTNSTLIGNAKHIDVVMSMYNLI